MSLAGLLFAFSAVAFASAPIRGAAFAAVLTASVGCGAMVLELGALRGMLLSVVGAMTAASVWVLLLAPRARLALRCAVASGLAGVATLVRVALA